MCRSALDYWFTVLDTDDDGFLCLGELQPFYKDAVDLLTSCGVGGLQVIAVVEILCPVSRIFILVRWFRGIIWPPSCWIQLVLPTTKGDGAGPNSGPMPRSPTSSTPSLTSSGSSSRMKMMLSSDPQFHRLRNMWPKHFRTWKDIKSRQWIYNLNSPYLKLEK